MPSRDAAGRPCSHEHCFCTHRRRSTDPLNRHPSLHPAAVHRPCAHRRRAAPPSRRVHLRAGIRVGRGHRRPGRRPLRRVLRSPTGSRGQLRRTGRAATGCCRRREPSPPEVSTPQRNSTSTGLDALRPSLVEMGRAVVREDHRNGGVVLLMWAGILAYLDRCGYDYVTGCVSVPVQGAATSGARQPDPRCTRLRAAQARRARGVHRVSVPAGDRSTAETSTTSTRRPGSACRR